MAEPFRDSPASGPSVPPNGDVCPITIDIKDAGSFEATLVGSKAKSLSALISLGCDVPEGFVVTSEAFCQIATFADWDTPDAEHAARGETDPANANAVIEQAKLPPEILERIRERYDSVFGKDDPPLAVRSSGAAEDTANASYAGQLESVLNVCGFESVVRAVRRCWASQFAPRYVAYHTSIGADHEIGRVAVIVQRLVDAEVSGVLFTINPLTGNEGEQVVESVFGLGEALLSGAVDADRYVIDRDSAEIREMSIANKGVRMVPTESGGLESVISPPDKAMQPTLEAAELRRLTSAAASIQEHLGYPVDIEWAIADGRVFFLQARPVTKIQFEPSVGLWTTADLRDGGVSSAVCTPFMWSLYRKAFQTALPAFMRRIRIRRDAESIEWIRLFFGRPYWNLGAVKDTLSRLPGYCERDLEEDLGITPDYEGPGQVTQSNIRTLPRAAPIIFSLPLVQLLRLAKNRRFSRQFKGRKERFELSPDVLSSLTDTDFSNLYVSLGRFQSETECAYYETIFNTSIAKIMFRSLTQKLNRSTSHALDECTLLGGLRNLSHTRPWKDLHRRFASGRRLGFSNSDDLAEDFARSWPHHGYKELDISVPRWPEDLSLVKTLIAQAYEAFENGQDPNSLERHQHERYQKEYRRALTCIGLRPLRRLRFAVSLKFMRAYSWWREEMRDYSSHLYSLMRLWTLEAGCRLKKAGWLEQVDDIWALDREDVICALDGRSSIDEISAKVAAGHRQVAFFRNFEPPGEVGGREYFAQPFVGDKDPFDPLRGIPCSSGRIEARARVVFDLRSAEAVQEGEILITKFTDPGWTLLFAKLGGIITENGGILSHAAVISRELGIPAVLGVPNATRLIPDGAIVVIDGQRGTIELLRS
jgi:pyruvate,water dikinase